MQSEPPLVECRALYRFYGKQAAVEDVSFSLHRGEVLGFLGPNGAGKSSTMNMLAGVLAPSHGSIHIGGCDLLEEPRKARRRIGYLPEIPPLYPELTVNEYLAFCARLRGTARSRVAEAVARARERCGLEAQGRRLVGNLSRGYQQRVGIAQAIVHEPDLVILDEPTVGLDPIQIREIRALITELGREHGVILSTHILPEVQTTCTRVQIMHRGRLVYRETTESLMADTAVTRTRVTFRKAPDESALQALSGVKTIEALGNNEFRLHHDSNSERLAESVARAALDSGWGLEALIPERRSLEQIFVEITSADEASGEAMSTETEVSP